MNALLKHTRLATLAALAIAAPTYAGLEHDTGLQGGEHLVLLEHRTTPEGFRICIREMPGDVRLKVVHDGAVTEVLDGTCQNFTAHHLSVALDSKLPPGDELDLKLRAIKG